MHRSKKHPARPIESLLKSPALSAVLGIVHGFGVRGVGVGEYLDGLGVSPRSLFRTKQVHGNCVHYLVQHKNDSLVGDAFITDKARLVCSVRSADCAPILIADNNRGAIAAVHAGWRGTAADAVGTAVKTMNRTFGTNPGDCVAAIGPTICPTCYKIGDDVVGALRPLELERDCLADGRLDLARANAALLERAGLSPSNIEIIPQCTCCDNTFASWRRDRRDHERQVSFIMIKD